MIFLTNIIDIIHQCVLNPLRTFFYGVSDSDMTRILRNNKHFTKAEHHPGIGGENSTLLNHIGLSYIWAFYYQISPRSTKVFGSLHHHLPGRSRKHRAVTRAEKKNGFEIRI